MQNATETATGAGNPPLEVTAELLGGWATNPAGPVALHLKQKLLPVEASDGEVGIIYPPTYANIGYSIDTLSDNTQVALVDSVGSQANRMEPIFKQKFGEGGPDGENGDWLVPQIEIVLHEEEARKQDKEAAREQPHREKRSLLDLAHRAADAVVQSCPTLKGPFEAAFRALQRGDAGPLCVLAPTSLVFGVWDSRGESGEKRPRLVRSVIRAWDVDVLHAAAQFNSVWKALTEDQKAELEKAKPKGVKLSEKGLKDAPAILRKTKLPIPPVRDGAPNPDARVLGGVLVRGRIEREVTVNLLALRNLHGATPDDTERIRKYLLGLALIAATHEIDLFLREGCHLRYAAVEDDWYAVPRRGPAAKVNLGTAARAAVLRFTLDAAGPFREKWPKVLEHQFDVAEAKKLLAKKDDDVADEE
jgi:CRISPR-associated protein Csb1